MAVGTPLFAARGGVVGAIGYGYLGIVIGNGECDFYVHIDRSGVALGATVSAGQLICWSGDKVPSGGVLYGAHLHFETQRGGWMNQPRTSIDPIPVLTGDDIMWTPEDADAAKWRIAVLAGVAKPADVPAEMQKYTVGIVPLPDLKAELDEIKKAIQPIDPKVAADLATVAALARKLGIP